MDRVLVVLWFFLMPLDDMTFRSDSVTTLMRILLTFVIDIEIGGLSDTQNACGSKSMQGERLFSEEQRATVHQS